MPAKTTTTPEHDARVASLVFADFYPHYVTKVQKKGRTVEELHTVIKWLTGFSDEELQATIDERLTLEEFFDRATLHPNAEQIKGVICGYRIEALETELTRKARYMDKLVDELAKGREIGKVLRGGS